MKISIISDIHAASYNQSGNKILNLFLNNKEVNDSDVVIFLGDIFDIMIGNYQEYFEEEKEFFTWIKANHKTKKIYFHEGNHDFHLEKLFKKQKFNISYHKSGFELRENDRLYYFEHGDDLEIDNEFYKFYKSIIRSRIVRKLAESAIIPFKIVQAIGTRASLRERTIDAKYRKKAESEIIKEKFRISYLSFKNRKDYDILVCGHGHVKDYFKSNDKIYINNGYAPVSQSFIKIENGKASFISLVQ